MKIISINLYEKIRYLLNGGIFAEPIACELNAKKSDTVLDFGCGTGAYSQIVTGKYLGVDIDESLISYARIKYGSVRKIFLTGTLKDLSVTKKVQKIDKAIVVNVLHHLNDNQVHENLSFLRKLIKKYLVIVDMDKAESNLWQKFLHLFDDGHFIRSREEFKKLIEQHFVIKKSFIYFPPTRSIRLCLFKCYPT